MTQPKYGPLVPWSGDIAAYITEEVTRQGHNVLRPEGQDRVVWMTSAWMMAVTWASAEEPITTDRIATLGKLVEKVANIDGFRKLEVTIGGRLGMLSAEVPLMIDSLMAKMNLMTPLEFYYQFELIHPFLDGNGRVGKILLNWMNGTLNAPVFPPIDLWGIAIRNP